MRIELVKHLLLEKIPQLQPEVFTPISLEFFQQAHTLLLNKDHEPMPIVSRKFWSIAFKNPINDVSMSAIKHLNNYYINLINNTNSFEREEEFIQQCVAHLKDASIYLPIDCDKSLAIIERAVIFIKTHLESFHGRFSYLYRELKLSSDIDLSMHKQRDKNDTFRVWVVAPTTNTKMFIDFTSADYIGDLRAEVQHWANTLLVKSNLGNTAPTKIILNIQGEPVVLVCVCVVLLFF